MAKKKNNGYEVDGQMFSPKQIEEYVKAVDKATSTIEKFTKSHENLTKAQEKNLKVTQKIKEGNERISKEWIKQQQMAYTQLGDNFAFDTTSMINKANTNKSKPLPKNISDWYNMRTTQKQKSDADKITQEISEKIYNQYSKNGTKAVTGKKLEEMNKRIELEASEKIAASADKYGKFTGLFEVASRTFSTAVSSITSIFKGGIGKHSSIYEDTFTNISVRTGMTRSGYSSNLTGLNNRLGSMGLMDNVAASDVMQMWNKMASIGIDIDNKEYDLLAQSIENVVTSKIVPYLDTTSLSVNQLNTRLDGNFIKQIRGINASNLEIAGNNYLTESLLNTIIEQVQPMSDAALQELVKGSSELTAYANKLMAPVSEGGAGLSASQANSIVTTILKTQKYGYQMLSSGSTFEKQLMTYLMDKNLNPNNLSDFNDIGAVITGLYQSYDSQSPGYGSAIDSVVTGAIGSAYGVEYGDMMIGNKMNNAGIMAYSTLGTDLSNTDIEKYVNGAYTSFLYGENQTNANKQTTYIENLTTDISDWKNQAGIWWDTGIELLKAIKDGIVAGPLVSLLGSAGPVALGIGAVSAIAGGIATGVSIISSQYQSNIEGKVATGQGVEAEMVANGVNPGIAAIEGAGATSDATNFVDITATGGLTPELAQQLGIEKKWYKSSKDEVNDALAMFESQHQWDKYNKVQFAKLAYGGDLRSILPLLAAINLSGAQDDNSVMGPLREMFGTTLLADSATLKAYFDENEDSYYAKASRLISSIDDIGNMGIKLYTSGGKEISLKSGSYDKAHASSEFGIPLRIGMDSVPYDNFMASLHAGEAVLTASTANELRNLLVEYRETNTQAVSFDAIIQNQTATLASKLDEIISTIKTSGLGAVNDNSSQSGAQHKLNNSMLRMTSTKQI